MVTTHLTYHWRERKIKHLSAKAVITKLLNICAKYGESIPTQGMYRTSFAYVSKF